MNKEIFPILIFFFQINASVGTESQAADNSEPTNNTDFYFAPYLKSMSFKKYHYLSHAFLSCIMKKKQVYSLCEAVADITYIAAAENYRTDDSREMINQFIQWAKEFERLHKHI